MKPRKRRPQQPQPRNPARPLGYPRPTDTAKPNSHSVWFLIGPSDKHILLKVTTHGCFPEEMPQVTDFPEILVARHGETEWNRIKRWQGDLDSDLTELGRDQARILGRILNKWGCTSESHNAYTSPKGRARMTAKLALGEAWPIVEDARLREIGVGSWTGKTRAEILAEVNPSEPPHFLELYELAPDGEGFAALKERCLAFLKTLEGPSVIITHGITSRMIRTIATGRDLSELGAIPGGQGVIHMVRDGKHTTLQL